MQLTPLVIPVHKVSVTKGHGTIPDGQAIHTSLASMRADKLTKDAPAHPTNASQSATDIPHEDVSKKQSDVQKQYPVPTMVKQGDTVTLTQVGLSYTFCARLTVPAFVQ